MAKKVITDGSVPLVKKEQELFCRLYAGNKEGKCFGNAVQSYLIAYSGADRIEKNTQALLVVEHNQKIAWKEKDLDAHALLKIQAEALTEDSRKAYANAGSCGPTLLRKPAILKRVNFLFDQYLDPAMMDREMAKVIAQDKDLLSKVAAYREVAKVRGRLTGKIEGELTVRWEDDEQPNESKKKKAVTKVAVKKAVEGIEWEE